MKTRVITGIQILAVLLCVSCSLDDKPRINPFDPGFDQYDREDYMMIDQVRIDNLSAAAFSAGNTEDNPIQVRSGNRHRVEFSFNHDFTPSRLRLSVQRKWNGNSGFSAGVQNITTGLGSLIYLDTGSPVWAETGSDNSSLCIYIPARNIGDMIKLTVTGISSTGGQEMLHDFIMYINYSSGAPDSQSVQNLPAIELTGFETWLPQTIASWEIEKWFFFGGSSGKIYRLNWDDAGDGAGSYGSGADVLVSTYHSDSGIWDYYESNNIGYSSSPAMSVTADYPDVYIKVTPTAYGDGNFSLRVHEITPVLYSDCSSATVWGRSDALKITSVSGRLKISSDTADPEYAYKAFTGGDYPCVRFTIQLDNFYANTALDVYTHYWGESYSSFYLRFQKSSGDLLINNAKHTGTITNISGGAAASYDIEIGNIPYGTTGNAYLKVNNSAPINFVCSNSSVLGMSNYYIQSIVAGGRYGYLDDVYVLPENP